MGLRWMVTLAGCLMASLPRLSIAAPTVENGPVAGQHFLWPARPAEAPEFYQSLLEGVDALTALSLGDKVPLSVVAWIRVQSDLEERADPDGDGYTNGEERRFVHLFSADEEVIEADYRRAIVDPDIPRRYIQTVAAVAGEHALGHLSLDVIPVIPVSIATSGMGTVYPGSGTHDYALYRVNDDSTWDYNTIVFHPVPARGWKLDEYIKLTTGINPFSVTLNANWEMEVWAVFEPGAVEFEFTPTEALSAFAARYFPWSDPIMFDWNGVGVVRFGNDFIGVLEPNDLPDLAEAAVLELLLNHPDFDVGKRMDFYYSTWRDVWNQNLAQARKDVAGRSDLAPWAATTIAVYTTMGPNQQAVQRLIGETLSISVDWAKYSGKLHRCIGPKNSITYSSEIMETHWAQVLEEHDPGWEMIWEFARRAISG